MLSQSIANFHLISDFWYDLSKGDLLRATIAEHLLINTTQFSTFMALYHLALNSLYIHAKKVFQYDRCHIPHSS
jgi:hypothetical protein